MLFPSPPWAQFLVRWDFKPDLLLLIINHYCIFQSTIFTVLIVSYYGY